MLAVNILIRWDQDNDEKKYERILWLGNKEDLAYVIDVYSNYMPISRSIIEIEYAIKEGKAQVEKIDPLIRIIDENSISETDKLKRDIAWEIIKDIVCLEPEIFIAKERQVLVKKTALVKQKSNKSILNLIKRYWTRGQTKNSLLPDYYLCGGKGKEKSRGSVKLGRPRRTAELIGVGVNVDENIKKIFRIAISKFYYTNAKNSLSLTYELMRKEFFVSNYKYEDNIKIPVLLPDSAVPTFAQFKYFFNKERNIKKEIVKRNSQKKYEQKHRPILGISTNMAIGPGAIYQIDATVGDVYLVSRFNRDWIIGRPVIYATIDVFSRVISGIYIGLEGPSWIGAAMCIANAASSKVKFCKEYGIEINEEDWPINYLPDTILADRGELEGKAVENLINGLHVKIDNTQCYRADMKGIIEQYFRTINLKVKPFLPGVVDFDNRERGDRDYRLDAKLDIYQFTQIIIRCVLYHNNHHILKNYNRDEMMIKDDIECIPIQLFKWGINNKVGILRQVSEDIVKLNLMPSDIASITAKGIKYKNLYYGSETGLKERWFEKARNNGSWKVDICFDPRNMNFIYIKNIDGKEYEKCFLFDYQSSYKDKSLDEIQYFKEKEKLDIKIASHSELQSKVELISQIESIVKGAEGETKEVYSGKSSNRKRLKGIKGNRKIEKNINREIEAFELDGSTAGKPENDSESTFENNNILNNDLNLFRKKQKEGLKKKYE